jgi:uncharacterized protein YjiK
MHNIFQTVFARRGYILVVFISLLISACRQKSHGSPEGYDFNKAQRREFKKVLNEISGLYFDRDSQSLLAISDSKDNIFQIDLKAQKLKDYAVNFAKRADFEDIVKVGKTVYVLISDGTILAVNKIGDSTRTRSFPFRKGKNDFESLYYDPALNGLVILCKTCEHEKGKKTRSAFRFDLDSLRFDSSILYEISIDSVKNKVLNSDISFKPSAAAINPADSLLYILASSGKLLVVTDRKGKVLHGYNLNPDRNPQAEGIAFSPNGTMFVSNEGKYGKATLQVFSYYRRVATQKKSNRRK